MKEKLVGIEAVPDYPGFDENIHYYAAATGGGDGWEADTPINESLIHDVKNADGNEEIPPGLKWANWINSLEVWMVNEYGCEVEVAAFNPYTWEWTKAD